MIYDLFMDYLPAWMFVVLFGLLLVGYPVAFTIGALALLFGWIGFGLGFFNLLPLRIWGVMQNFTLVAVPLFVFMGVTLERSGLAEELLDTMALLFGRLRGGLSISVIVVGALLAASTGIVGATTVTMGLLALPPMMRRNYSPELATGTIAASGTLGQIIPPSIVLVVLADIIGIFGGMVAVAAELGQSPDFYLRRVLGALSIADVASGLIKSAVFAVIIALIACHRGLTVTGGAAGVGAATTRTVVSASISILISDFFITKFLLWALV